MARKHHKEMQYETANGPHPEGIHYGSLKRRKTEHGMTQAEWNGITDPQRAASMRMQGMGGARMISEDHEMPSNLPGTVIRRMYPQAGESLAPYLNDTITGIDDQMTQDGRNIMRQFKTRKI